MSDEAAHESALSDVHLPEREIRKAYDAGYSASTDGKSKDACPFVLPAMRNAWLAGYEASEGFK